MSTPQPRWLTERELELWRTFTLVMSSLPPALSQQLQESASLTFVEYQVLAGLSEAEGRRMRLSRLALFASTELSRLSHLVKRLEARGLVRRERDPDDGRSTNAILTDEGLAHLRAAAPGHVDRVRDLVFDVLTPEQQDALADVSRTLVARLYPNGY